MPFRKVQQKQLNNRSQIVNRVFDCQLSLVGINLQFKRLPVGNNLKLNTLFQVVLNPCSSIVEHF